MGSTDGSVRHFTVPKLGFEDWKQDTYGKPVAFAHIMGLSDLFSPTEEKLRPTVSVVLQDTFLGLLLIRGHRSGTIVYQKYP